MIKAKAKISIGQGIPGRNIELRNNITHIQWKYLDEDDTEWKDLISLEELQASEIELQVNDTHIKWRYEYEDTWKDLISLEELTPSIEHLESAVINKIKELDDLKNTLEENESSRNETFNQKISEVDTAIFNVNKTTQDVEEKLVEITSEYSTLKNDILKTSEDIELAEQQRQQNEEDRQQAETNRKNIFKQTIENANSKIEDLTTLENYLEDEETKRQEAETNRFNKFNETINSANSKIEDLTRLENYVEEEEAKRQDAETNRTSSFDEAMENTYSKIQEADDKIVDIEKRMKYIEDNFGELVSGEGMVTKEYLENNHYNKDNIDEQMNNKADSNHTHENASTTKDGFMSKEDKDKLDEIENGANKTIIINDLTTGGNDKALSAEQGKKLMKDIAIINYSTQGTNLAVKNYKRVFSVSFDKSRDWDTRHLIGLYSGGNSDGGAMYGEFNFRASKRGITTPPSITIKYTNNTSISNISGGKFGYTITETKEQYIVTVYWYINATFSRLGFMFFKNYVTDNHIFYKDQLDTTPPNYVEVNPVVSTYTLQKQVEEELLTLEMEAIKNGY